MSPTNRSHPANRCPGCLIRPDLCFCDRITPLQLDTRVVIVMHATELKLTTNTASLAQACLPNSHLRVRGLPGGAPCLDDLAPGAAPGSRIMLFPHGDAQLLTPELAASLPKPLTLVVTDGTWRQAAKTTRREPVLATMPCVKLPPGPLSEYRLRNEPAPHMVCTFEAIARALGIIEGPEVQATLEEVFRTKVRRTLWSRGILQFEAKQRGEVPRYPG